MLPSRTNANSAERRIASRIICFFVAIIIGAVKADDQSPMVPCSICRTGTMTLPNKLIGFPGAVGKISCQKLDEEILPLLYPNNSAPFCKDIQSVGALCGCPSPSNACTLCKDDVPMTFPNRPLYFFSDQFSGIAPDCELMGAHLKSTYTEDSTNCTIAQSFLPEYCECLGSISDESNLMSPPCSLCEDGSPITLPDEQINIEGFPFSTCSQVDIAVSSLFKTGSELCTMFQSLSTLCGCPRKENSCSMCPDGSPIAFPDKPARFLKGIFGTAAPSCKVYEAYSHSLELESEDCKLMHLTSGFCGCPSVDDHCQICDEGDGLEPEYEEVKVDRELVEFLGVNVNRFAVTCELVFGMENQLHKDDPLCQAARTRRDVCGCNDGIFVYANANSEQKKRVLALLPAISGGLSLLAALAIILDVARDKKRRQYIYNQLMAAMSVCDVLSSMAYVVSTVANPTDDFWPVYGERGNDASCTAQAFFLQLSMASLAYNVSLTMYYYMCIVLGWRDGKLKSKVKYLHAAPILLGLALAFASIPFYGTVLTFCHVPSPPLHDSWAPVRWLKIIPILAAITICTIVLFLVWLRVHLHARKSSDWDFSSDTPAPETGHETQRQSCWTTLFKDKSTLTMLQRVEHSAMWQALDYVVIVYVSWISKLVLAKKGEPTYEVYCIVAFLIPLHPFLNAINYFRPRLQRRCRRHPFFRRRNERAQTCTTPELETANESSSSCSATIQAEHVESEQSKNIKEIESNNGYRRQYNDEFDAILEPSAYFEGKEPGGEDTNLSKTDDAMQQAMVETRGSLNPTVMACIAEESHDEVEEEL